VAEADPEVDSPSAQGRLRDPLTQPSPLAHHRSPPAVDDDRARRGAGVRAHRLRPLGDGRLRLLPRQARAAGVHRAHPAPRAGVPPGQGEGPRHRGQLLLAWAGMERRPMRRQAHRMPRRLQGHRRRVQAPLMPRGQDPHARQHPLLLAWAGLVLHPEQVPRGARMPARVRRQWRLLQALTHLPGGSGPHTRWPPLLLAGAGMERQQGQVRRPPLLLPVTPRPY